MTPTFSTSRNFTGDLLITSSAFSFMPIRFGIVSRRNGHLLTSMMRSYKPTLKRFQTNLDDKIVTIKGKPNTTFPLDSNKIAPSETAILVVPANIAAAPTSA